MVLQFLNFFDKLLACQKHGLLLEGLIDKPLLAKVWELAVVDVCDRWAEGDGGLVCLGRVLVRMQLRFE
jgi:hypothetical protein